MWLKNHVVKEPRFSLQSPAGAGCENVALRRLKRLLRRLEQLQRHYNNSMASSFKTFKIWQSVVSSRPFLLKFSTLFDAVDLPSAPLLRSMIDQLQKALASVQAQETYKHVNIAREKLQQDWKSKPSNVYSKVDPVLYAPTRILQTSEGKLTGNFQEIETLSSNAWLPIFDKYSSQPEPNWSNFEQRYGQYFPKPVSMTLRPFTTAGLRTNLTKMKTRSASGPDACAVSDLMNLPD